MNLTAQKQRRHSPFRRREATLLFLKTGPSSQTLSSIAEKLFVPHPGRLVSHYILTVRSSLSYDEKNRTVRRATVCSDE